jgi:aspartate oxidase
MAVNRIRTRFLVVGSGVAGLHTAWRASAHGDVVVLTKRSLFDSATAYAQGGIAAALGAGDSPELHRQDTLAAGAALCDAAAVEVLVAEGPQRVRDLASIGARFDTDVRGKFALSKEAAHSRKRIVHAHGDQTGAEVARTLIERVRETKSITVLERARALDLIVVGGRCIGIRASHAGRPVEIIADATVLATGGCGQVYRYTTNPQVATGDGFAIAHRAGVRLADMEFVRVWIDARKLSRVFARRFPGILRICLARGIDPRKDRIPVTPAAHYMMGGIVTDLAGRSSLERLYACGEVSRTGVHGANRLASNSLLEGLVFAERVARDMVSMPRLPRVAKSEQWTVPALRDRGAAQVAADRIRLLMWEHAGIDRSAKGLRKGLAQLEEITRRLSPGATEELNLAASARLITEAALMRTESRGGHFRHDFPREKRKWRGKHIEW